jgi:hypothetical protein
MLYMVECGFADPAREAEWCAWYDGPKLASLLALPGWRGSQRFMAVEDIAAPWLAVHAVPGLEFFESEVYKNAGGGNFADWGPLITNWSRNLFDGMAEAPEVPADALLAVADVAPGTALPVDARFTWLTGVGLDNSVPDRAIAILPAGTAAARPVRLYRPTTPLMRGTAP